MSIKQQALTLRTQGYTYRHIASVLLGRDSAKETIRAWCLEAGVNVKQPSDSIKPTVAKLLFLDIETSQMLFGGWGMFNQNYSLEQIEEDWTLLSYCAKWAHTDDIIEKDASTSSEVEMLEDLHKLLDEADFMCAHNGRRFDMKKMKARMIMEGMKPFSPVRVIDTYVIAKDEFGFTSNKLAYLTSNLCKTNIKSSHATFPGYSLWKEFKRGNIDAIKEMVDYNRVDVLSLEELYYIFAPWSSKLPNFDSYTTEEVDMKEWENVGVYCTNLGMYDKYRHKTTGHYRRGRTNLLSAEKRKQLLANIIV